LTARLTAVASLALVACIAIPAAPPLQSPGVALAPADGGAAGRAVPLFANASAAAGLSGVGGNFFAWGDYDNDGHEDLLVDGQRLFRNNGPPGWTFTEVTAAAGIGQSGANCGNWADYDNDGYLDLFCPSGGWSTDYDPRWDVLWHNNGDGTFTNVTEAAGHVTDGFPSVAAGWGDYDRDGFVDLYVANYENASMSSYYPDVLWRNDGDGTFTNATSSAHMNESADPKPGRGVSWCDFNNDGWPDVYVSNYRLKANYLYINDRDGTFTEWATHLNCAGEPTNRLGQTYYGHSVGAAWSDIDNDGDFDLWVTNLAHKDPYRGPICDDSELYLNYGNASIGGINHNYDFTGIRDTSGIPTKRILGGEDELFVGCAWGDFDNDGYEDLFIPQIYNDITYAYSFLYRNNGNNTFTDVSEDAGVRVWDTYGGAWCDFDGDGDLDLVTGGKGTPDTNGTHEIHLYRNLLNDQGDSTWLGLRLVGTKSNAAAIGARVYAYENPAEIQMREVQGGMGPHSMQSSMVVHFGHAGHTRYLNIRIDWPSGLVQNLLFREDDLVYHLNQTVTIVEPALEPDLVSDIELVPSSPVEGDRLLVRAHIKNTGSKASAEYTVRMAMDGETVRDLRIDEPLQAQASRTFEHVYDTTGKAGTHELTVRATSTAPPDANPGNDDRSRIFTVLPAGSGRPPVASLAVTPAGVQLGQPAYFDGGGSYDPDGTVTAYEFTFGDGQSSGWVADTVVQHSYASPGTYTASLRVRDNSSMTSGNDARAPVTVSLPPNKPPVARIASILPNPATEGDAVTFTGDAYDPDGRVVACCWTSSIDGDLATAMTFSWTGLSTGTHTVWFRVRDDRGDWSARVSSGVEVSPRPANQPPVARIVSISPNPAVAGESVRFNGIGDDPDGSVVEYRWSSSLQGVLGSGTPLTVSSLVEGAHVVTLAVRDDDGASSADTTARLVVEPAPEPETPNRAPRASLSVSRSVMNLTDVLVLDGGGSTDPDGRVMLYLFDFGDGTDSCWTLSPSVDHSYASPGQYVVRLRVQDDKGAQSPWSREITVEVKAARPKAAEKGLLPGMEGAAAAGALLGALFLGRHRRKRPA